MRVNFEVRELLKALKEMGKTILISSHILHELSQLCTRIGIIEAGQMVAEGSLDDIFRQLKLQRIIHVQLVRPNNGAIDKIRALQGVDGVDQLADRMAVRLREDQMSIEDLHDNIHAMGAGIHMFQPEAMDMETAFMKLTEGKTA